MRMPMTVEFAIASAYGPAARAPNPEAGRLEAGNDISETERERGFREGNRQEEK